MKTANYCGPLFAVAEFLVGIFDISILPRFPLVIDLSPISSSIRLVKKSFWIAFGITTGFSLLAFFLMLFLRAGNIYSRLSDAFFVGGTIVLAFLGFRVIGRSGTFDLLGYASYRFFEAYRHQGMDKRFEDAGDYHEYKLEQRAKNKFVWLPYFIIGLTEFALGVVFMIVFLTNSPAVR